MSTHEEAFPESHSWRRLAMTAGARFVSLIPVQPVTVTANSASAAAWRSFMRDALHPKGFQVSPEMGVSSVCPIVHAAACLREDGERRRPCARQALPQGAEDLRPGERHALAAYLFGRHTEIPATLKDGEARSRVIHCWCDHRAYAWAYGLDNRKGLVT